MKKGKLEKVVCQEDRPTPEVFDPYDCGNCYYYNFCVQLNNGDKSG